MDVVADGLRQATEIHEQEGIGHRFSLSPLARKLLIGAYAYNIDKGLSMFESNSKQRSE